MRSTRNLYAAVLMISAFGFATHAKADTLILGLNNTAGFENVAAGQTVSQNVQFSASANIDGFAFYLSDPSGAALTYAITDVTTSTTVFSETFDDTTLDATLTNIAIPESSKAWLELYMTPITINAGNDIYAFSVTGAGPLKVGINPTASTEIGVAPVGDLVLGLRVYDPPPASVTPEPSSLMLMGTGVLAIAGTMRRRLMQQS
jgi:PEP-CTERM motif